MNDALRVFSRQAVEKFDAGKELLDLMQDPFSGQVGRPVRIVGIEPVFFSFL
jgi:hypothetical protein